jgi:RNA ligase (TIGR02306 family)
MKLASIEKILELSPIPDADKIEKAKILGWDVIVRKGLYEEGDLVVYVFLDTLIPKKYLDENCEDNSKIRLKMVKMRGQYSAGLVLPLSLLPEGINIEEGLDVGKILNIEKYEKQIPAQLAGDAKGNFPTEFGVSKTDEDNLLSNLKALRDLENYNGDLCVSVKEDGSSLSVFLKDGEFIVCSRNLNLKETEGNSFWQIVRKLDLENNLRKVGGNWVIQGELVGNKINNNRAGYKELKFKVFLIKNLDNGVWLDYNKMKEFCGNLNLETVQILDDISKDYLINNLKDLQEFVDNLKYENGAKAEGIVIRTAKPFSSNVLQKSWWSVKLLNRNYKD